MKKYLLKDGKCNITGLKCKFYLFWDCNDCEIFRKWVNRRKEL